MRTFVPGVAAVLLVLLAACDSLASLPVGSPGPGQVALQASDLPRDLQRCPISGAIEPYLSQLKTANPEAYDSTSDTWRSLRETGASDAAIVSFAVERDSCKGQFGTGAGRTASSFVIRFRDEGSAESGFRKGLAGFPTPAEGQQLAGLARGAATGLGRNSWVLQREVDGRSLAIAFWQSRAFAVFFVAEDLEPGETRRALDGVSGRVR